MSVSEGEMNLCNVKDVITEERPDQCLHKVHYSSQDGMIYKCV